MPVPQSRRPAFHPLALLLASAPALAACATPASFDRPWETPSAAAVGASGTRSLAETDPCTEADGDPPVEEAGQTGAAEELAADGALVNPEIVDETARLMYETVCSAVFWFDGLFGEQGPRQRKAARGVHGRAELALAYSEFDGFKQRLRFNARVELPNVKERLSAFVGRDSEDKFVRGRNEGFALRSRFPRFDDREETIAGLGYSLPDNYRVKTEFRSGVRFSGIKTPRLFAQARFATNAYADEYNLWDLRSTLFVNTVDGFGVTLSGDYSHVLSQTKLFRWNSAGTISQKTAGFDWRSALILYQSLRKKRAIAYEIFIRGATAAPEPLAEYGAQVIFRQPILDERMYVGPVLGYSWPRVDPLLARDGSAFVALLLELPFGNPERQ